MLRTVLGRTSIFFQRLACIIIDKANLIWGWKIFQKHYTELKILRYYFPTVLMIALSTILLPNVLSYIEESLHLYTLSRLYKYPLDCPNITQMINNTTKIWFEDLNFLITKARLIPKTMVFVDNIDDEITLAACVWSLLLLELCKLGEGLIRVFYSNQEISTQSDFLKDFRTKETRI